MVGNGVAGPDSDDLDDDLFRGSSKPSRVSLHSSLDLLLIRADWDDLDQLSVHYSFPFFRPAPRLTRAKQHPLP